MNSEMLLVSLLPLVLFVFIEVKYGIKAGIWTAIIVAIAGLIYFYLKIGKVDAIMITEILLLIALGVISLKMMNARLFKLQPVFVSVVLSLYFGYCQLYDEPVLVKMTRLFSELSPGVGAVYESELGRGFLATLSGHSIILFLLHGLLVYWGATRLKSFGWLMTRLAFYPMAFIFMIVEFSMNTEFLIELQKVLNNSNSF